MSLKPLTPKTSDNFARIVIEPTEGTKTVQTSHNFCDRTTWYGDSVRIDGEILSSSDDVTFVSVSGSRAWVDVNNYKITKERKLRPTYGLLVWVNGQPQEETIPGRSGAFSVDYLSGTVTFTSSLPSDAAVTASYSYVNGTTWIVAPDAGKKLRLGEAEVQFSVDVNITDTSIFQVYGLVDVFAPQLMPGVPSGTKIPVGDAMYYDTMNDYVAESNKSYPQIVVASTGSWRGFNKPRNIYSWDYDAAIDLNADYGMEIRVNLSGGQEFEGEYAVVALYGVVTDL